MSSESSDPAHWLSLNNIQYFGLLLDLDTLKSKNDSAGQNIK